MVINFGWYQLKCRHTCTPYCKCMIDTIWLAPQAGTLNVAGYEANPTFCLAAWADKFSSLRATSFSFAKS